jgi:hypothetical protein
MTHRRASASRQGGAARGLGFLDAAWAIYGAKAVTVFLGFLLTLAASPVHVAIRWRNRNVIREET